MRQTKSFKDSIIYVNFSPYENTGKILDYLTASFQTVLLFSFNFHRLSKKQEPSTLFIYKYGKIIEKKSLFQTPTNVSLAFILLPIRSIVIFLQLFWHTLFLKNKYGPFYLFFP